MCSTEDVTQPALAWSTGGLSLAGNGGAGSFLGDLTGANAANKAEQAQTDAAKANTALQREMWQKSLELNKPFYDSGVNALGQLQSLHAPSMTMDDFHASPDYNFRLQQGQNTVLSGAAANGMRLSGATLKALSDLGQNTAAQEWSNWYGRRMGEYQDQWSQLAQLAGFGQGASSQAIAANTNAANGISAQNSIIGQAKSAAAMQPYNSFMNLLGQGATLYGVAK